VRAHLPLWFERYSRRLGATASVSAAPQQRDTRFVNRWYDWCTLLAVPFGTENRPVACGLRLALTAALLYVAHTARAGDDEAARAPADPTVWDRPYAFALVGDPFSWIFSPAPYGVIGGSIGYAPLPWLSVDAGIGVGNDWAGSSRKQSAQYTLMPRARWIIGQDALALGAGISEGAYQWNEMPLNMTGGPSSGTRKEWNHAWRANIEISYERRAVSGLTVRPHVGLATILNPGAGVCTFDCSLPDTKHPNPFLYVGFAIGYGL
jgi:hypothetical protein